MYGYLRTMPVPELLQWIGHCRKTGSLRVSTEDGTESLAFRDGELMYSASTDPGATLGRTLIDAGLLTEDLHAMAWGLRERFEIGVGKALLDLNLVRRDDLLESLQRKAERQLQRLFLAPDGFFRFDGSLPCLDLLPIGEDVTRTVLRVTQGIDELHLEAAASF